MKVKRIPIELYGNRALGNLTLPCSRLLSVKFVPVSIQAFVVSPCVLMGRWRKSSATNAPQVTDVGLNAQVGDSVVSGEHVCREEREKTPQRIYFPILFLDALGRSWWGWNRTPPHPTIVWWIGVLNIYPILK